MGSPIKGETARVAPTPPPAPPSPSVKDSPVHQYVPPHSQSAIQQVAHAVNHHSYTGGTKVAARSTGYAGRGKPPPPVSRARLTGTGGTVFGQSIGSQAFQNRTFNAGQQKLLQRVISAAQQQPMIRTMNTDMLRELQRYDSGFQRYAQQLWQRAKGFYPKGAQQPPIDLPRPTVEEGGPNVGMLVYPQNPPGLQNAAAWVNRTGGDTSGGHLVHVSQETAQEAFDPQSADNRAFAQETPIHEWAHVFQSNRTLGNRTTTEGGAEAFKQAIARRLGMISDAGTNTYPDLVGNVRATQTPNWILRGQFAPVGYGANSGEKPVLDSRGNPAFKASLSHLASRRRR